MKCPVCKDSELTPSKLDASLAALTCRHCDGCLIDLLSYRLWLAEGGSLPSLKTAPPLIEDSQSALTCAKCDKLMSKYRISEATRNKLDLCASCGSVWLDGGEWELLQQLELTELVPRIFAPPWQDKIKKAEIRKQIEENFAEKLGQEAWLRVAEFRDWLNKSNDRDTILRMLNEK